MLKWVFLYLRSFLVIVCDVYSGVSLDPNVESVKSAFSQPLPPKESLLFSTKLNVWEIILGLQSVVLLQIRSAELLSLSVLLILM